MTRPEPGMGRGLAAILSISSEEAGTRAEDLRELPVGRIAPNPKQPRRRFDEEALRRNLEVPAWLEEKARAHDRVLGGAVGTAPLVPLRFGTVMATKDAVAGTRACLTRPSGGLFRPRPKGPGTILARKGQRGGCGGFNRGRAEPSFCGTAH